MRTAASLALSLASSILLAQSVDVPLTNWTVPTYRAASASGGLMTMSDVTPGVGFVGIQPCRVADTRGNGAPIQGGIFANSALRTWDLTGLCGLPAGTDAISANFTVVAAGGIPQGSFLLAWPTGQPPPPTAIMTYGPGQIISNAAIVPLGPGEQLNVNVSGSTHIVMDVNGYFTDQYNPGVSFHAVSSNVAPAILGENSATVANAVAVQGVITSTNPGASATAVRGINNGTGGSGVGVFGSHAGGGYGTVGYTQTGTGAIGIAFSSTTTNYGVYGNTQSNMDDSAGVLGLADPRPTSPFQWLAAGVRGESRNAIGVLGLSEITGGARGVVGAALNAVGNEVVSGRLGYGLNGVNYGVYSEGNAHVNGTFTAINKNFVEPHPLDASKEIRYVSLEGPRSEVYFRGTAQVSQGVTRIPIPEEFRLVAARDTYSTLVTPLGSMATVAVISEGEDGIVIEASRNVKVHYVVYAERESIHQSSAIIDNVHFRGDSEVEMRHFPDSYRQRMIQNRTLNPDGTVNMETARRLGWDKDREKHNPPVALPAPE